MRTKIAILLIVTFAIAAVGAGWKWHSFKNSQGQYRIAGWTWGEDAVAAGPHLRQPHTARNRATLCPSLVSAQTVDNVG